MSFVKYSAVLLLAFFLSGCETVPSQSMLEVEAKNIVVLPADSLHKELDPFYGDVQHRLASMIVKKGFKVVTIEGSEYKKLFNEALTVSGSMYDPNVGKEVPLNRNTFSKAMIDLVSEKYPFDVIILPELVLRAADVEGDKAVWDGIKRDFTWIEKPEDVYRLPPRVSGLSLRLAAYTSRGAEIMVNFSGITLPYNLRADNGKFTFEMKDPFFSREELNDGVDLSLKSFFKQVELQ